MRKANNSVKDKGKQVDDKGQEQYKIGEKTMVFNIGYTMHKFLMANKNPRVPEDPIDDLQRGRFNNTVWKCDAAHVESDRNAKLLKKWLFDTENPKQTKHHEWKTLREHNSPADSAEKSRFGEIICGCLSFLHEHRLTLKELRKQVAEEVAFNDPDSKTIPNDVHWKTFRDGKTKEVRLFLKIKRKELDDEKIGGKYNHSEAVAKKVKFEEEVKKYRIEGI